MIDRPAGPAIEAGTSGNGAQDAWAMGGALSAAIVNHGSED
jgi:hypothetical protein